MTVRRFRRRAWWFPALVTLLVVALVMTLPAPSVGVVADGPWWAVAVAMFVTQSFPIHMTTRRGRHTVAMTEAVLAVALLTHTPQALVLGSIVGLVPALLRRRTEPIKFAVNLTQVSLWIVVTATVFHHLVEPGTSLLTAVFAALAVCLAAFVGSSCTLRLPIGLATGNWRWADGELWAVATTLAIASAATSVALLGVLVATASPLYLVLLVLPLVQVGLSLRERARAEESRRIIEFVTTVGEELRAPDVDVVEALEHMVALMRTAYGADRAYLLAVGPKRTTVRRTITETSSSAVSSLPHEDLVRAWLHEHADGGPAIGRASGLGELRAAFDARELLVVPLRSDGDPGVVVLAGRPLGAFGADHVELARTVGAAASAALDRALLSSELDQAGRIQAELERRASHDPLTGLANRSRFDRELDDALAGTRPVGLLYVDLTGFKEVNDTLGHAVGDQLLVEAAQRLSDAVRPGDVVARLGGDEFAVLLHPADRSLAQTIGGRVLEALNRPLAGVDGIDGIRAAVGAAAAAPGESAEALLRRADAAMYGAKREGSITVHMAAAAVA